MDARLSRRSFAAIPGLYLATQGTPDPGQPPAWESAPIGWPGRLAGDGFRIGHGFQCENSWFSPGWWHTGEDWYALDGDTAGAEVRAIAPGEVVYADFDYPGRVVIIQHATDLYSVYGHLDLALAVQAGQQVVAGTVLGVVLQQAAERSYRQAPSHLHFEMRRFLIRDDVNGTSPGFGVRCGYQCPPGPGYWPQSAPDLPVDLQWLNPTHTRFTFMVETMTNDFQLQPQTASAGGTFPLHDGPDGDVVGTLQLAAGELISVHNLAIGDASTRETSALGYLLWAKVETEDTSGWLQVAVPSDAETGGDGRPSSVQFPFLLGIGHV